MKMIRHARNENQALRALEQVHGIKVKIENEFAREVEAQRGWERDGYNITRHEEETQIKTIGGLRRGENKFKYILWGWTGGGYSRWDIEDPEAIEIFESDSLLDCVLQIDKLEMIRKVDEKLMGDFWAEQAKLEEEWAKQEDGCRDCGKPAGGCIYCDECASNKRCHHGNKLGDCSTCDYEGDLAYTAGRER